jgi:uncharacterized protein
LRAVPRLGAKAFEQAAGFLRVRGGAHPLDASAVHPERYALVEQMAADLGVAVQALIGDDALVDRIPLPSYVRDDVGMPTLRDIVAELKKPGRDPRSAFEPPAFREDIQKPSDLLPGMVLEGVVTNIVAFGCFVDIGVHQDGLVHVSQLADRYVRDANEVVKVGQKVKVTVQSVDLARGRIALSMRSDGGTGIPGTRGASESASAPRGDQSEARPPRSPGASPSGPSGGSKNSGPQNSGSQNSARPKPGFVPTKGAVAPNGIRFK